MSHSRIFDEYAKIMSEKGLVKNAADKKDTDYNVVPDKAGPDTKVDETGWELTEIAHPEQVQVSNSRLNDGIVENGVEKQKAMIDVALRNPRGVLASDLVKTLIKAANILDAELTDESLKMAAEIDSLIEKLAAGEALSSDQLISLAEEVLNRFGDLDFSTMGFSSEKNKEAKQTIYQAIVTLKKFLQDMKTAGPKVGEVIQGFAQYMQGAHKAVLNALKNTTDWGSDDEEALNAWDNLKIQTDSWYQGEKPTASPAVETPGIASREQGHSARPKYLHSPQVKQLQQMLGVSADSAFGPQTFGALMEAAKTNSKLNQLMENAPKTYQGWTNEQVGEAIQRMQDGTPAQKKDEVLNPYPEGYEVGYQGAKRGPQPDIKE